MPSPFPRRYETVYILKPGIADDDETAIHQKIDSVISKFQGNLELREDMGPRDMAYSIAGYRTGKYCVINYSAVPGVVSEIERHFKISDDVIRYSTVLVDEEYDYTKIKKQVHMAEEEYKRYRETRMKRH